MKRKVLKYDFWFCFKCFKLCDSHCIMADVFHVQFLLAFQFDWKIYMRFVTRKRYLTFAKMFEGKQFVSRKTGLEAFLDFQLIKTSVFSKFEKRFLFAERFEISWCADEYAKGKIRIIMAGPNVSSGFNFYPCKLSPRRKGKICARIWRYGEVSFWFGVWRWRKCVFVRFWFLQSCLGFCDWKRSLNILEYEIFQISLHIC